MEENIIKWKDFIFELFGTIWKVHFVDFIDEEEICFGNVSSTNEEITVALRTKDGYKFSDNQIIITLTHEIIHSIAQTGQYININHDEPFIEWVARCILSLIKQNVFSYVKK